MKNKLVFIGWILLSIFVTGACVKAANDDIVACIGSNTFFRRDFRLSTGTNAPVHVGQSTNVLLWSDDMMQAKVRQLADWVLNTSIEKAARDMGITVTEAERNATLSNIYRDDNQIINNLTYMMRTLPIALREALSSPEKEKEIYEKYLAHKMAYETWQGHLARYNTEEKIASLNKMVLPTKNDLYKPIPSLEEILLKKKLRQKITENISTVESQIREAYFKQYPNQDVPYETVRLEIQTAISETEKEKAWQVWLVETLKRADIVIYDDLIKAAYVKFLEDSVSQGHRGQTVK